MRGEVIYDPAQISYGQLSCLLAHIDPTNGAGQFCDYGDSYRTVIFVHDAAERQLAFASKQSIERRRDFASCDILPADVLSRGEYHQDYAKKNRSATSLTVQLRRDAKLKELWGSAP